jgi:hypothetical protein
MIVYHASKLDFLADVESGMMDDIVLRRYYEALGSRVGPAERRAWQNSLRAMHVVLIDVPKRRTFDPSVNPPSTASGTACCSAPTCTASSTPATSR